MSTTLKRTPLFEQHKNIGGKLVDFAGWELPVQYAGVIEEHKTVRENAGLFDVSHMGELRITGAEALDALQSVLCNNLAKIVDGQAQYTAALNEQGGVIDDLIVYRISETEFLLCVNASNTDAVLSWLKKRIGSKVSIKNESSDTALCALQGPKAAEILAKDSELAAAAELGVFRCAAIEWKGHSLFLARTGYTGEDGFEIFMPNKAAAEMWKFLVEEQGVSPIGLAARDTLRLEAGYPLHGHELQADISALESGLSWIVKFKKPVDFCGKSALAAQKEAGLKHALVGFELSGPGIARHDDLIVDENEEIIGKVTSGTRSPSLGKSIGLARVPVAHKAPGSKITVKVRKRLIEAEVIKLPFYSRKK